MWDNEGVEYSDVSTDTMLSAPGQAVLLAGGVAFGSTDRMDASRLARLWARVDRTRPDGCWEWTGHRDKNGYGKKWANGRQNYAHRLIYTIERGPVSDDLDLDHLCRNRGCVNPAHLEPVTHRENCRRSPLIMAERTACKRGHDLDYTGPDGRRGCRQCRYGAVVRWRERKAAA